MKVVLAVLGCVVFAAAASVACRHASAAGNTGTDTVAIGTLVVTSDIHVASDIRDGSKLKASHTLYISDTRYSYTIIGPYDQAAVRNGKATFSVSIPYKWALSSTDAQVSVQVVVGDENGSQTYFERTITVPSNGKTTLDFYGSY